MEMINVNGKEYQIDLILKDGGRHATARFKDGKIVIRIPKWVPKQERARMYDYLKRDSIRLIETGRWKERKKLRLVDGTVLNILGKEYAIKIIQGNRWRLRIEGNTIVASGSDCAEDGAAKKLGKLFLPEIKQRVKILNARYFGFNIKSISMRNTKTIWGSCSRDGKISLSTRLLFVPPEILDYVIIHELAHARIKNHNKSFWGLVAKAMPDHMERKSWLRKNSMEIPVI